MVKHIVLFKLSESQSPENKLMHLTKLEKIFSPLGKEFPFIVEYRTGINFNETASAWDFTIDSIFRNKEDLRKYQNSGEHREAVRQGSEIEKIKAVIDYEF